MRTSTTRTLPSRLSKARQRFEHWRSTRKQRSRIPEDLWALAVGLAREYGLYKTVRTLRLDYYSLKKRLDAPSSDGTSGEKPISSFVELLPSKLSSSPECIVELEDAGGAKMRIHLKGADVPDLATLSRSFWRGEA